MNHYSIASKVAHFSRILRLREVMQAVGLSRSSIYRLVKKEAFPAPIKLSASAIGWDADSISLWLQERKIASMVI